METLNHAMSLHMRSVQLVRPPSYAPKYPTPPPYRSPTPVGNARNPSTSRQPHNNSGTNNAPSGRPQIIGVQSRGSPVDRSTDSPPPSPRTRPSTRTAVGTNAYDSRQDPRTHRVSAVRPAENSVPYSSTLSRRPVSPASSTSLPSVFRANSPDARATPGPTAGLRLSPVNRLVYPSSRANVSRRSTVDNRRHYGRYLPR